MSFRFLFWTFASCLIISGVVGWLFFGERGVDPEEQALLAYEVSLNAERRSAERGGVEDWTRYARSLVTGSASLRNPKSAMQWYRKAADQGYPAAQVYQLALPYAVRVAAHVEDYSVPEALKRIEASMNQSQIDAAKKRLSALKK